MQTIIQKKNTFKSMRSKVINTFEDYDSYAISDQGQLLEEHYKMYNDQID